MTTELHNAEVNLDALLELLGRNLYSSPSVAIRELVQNAHDACSRRHIEDPLCPSLEISLTPDSATGTLQIDDNGSGLTRDEVLKFLATIGSGYSRQIREERGTDEIIGYFGLGFLSAYVVAEKVEVWTTSYQTPDRTWHFTSSGGKRFTLTPSTTRSIGTSVKLRLSSDYVDLSVPEVLESLVRRYCCLLPFPIRSTLTGDVLNDTLVPWQLPSDVPLTRRTIVEKEFAQLFEHTFEPICTFALASENSSDAKGLMWIQDASGYVTSDYRNVALFVRNMHITHEARDLLPLWAGFAGCVVECRHLSPTASREDVQKDHHYQSLQQLLAEQLIDGLSQIARQQPENWRRILTRHNQALLAAAVNDDRLFALLADDLKVPTTHGDLSLKQILASCDGHIYLRTDQKNNYEDVLFKARRLPVVSGYLFGASGFCDKYARIRNVDIVRLGNEDSANALFAKSTLTPEEHERLQLLFVKDNEELSPCSFSPDYLPMVFLENKEAKLKKRIEDDDADKRIGSAALSLARLHTNSITETATRKVLVNTDNTLIKRMMSDATVDESTRQLADMVRAYMITLCYDVSDDETDFAEEARRFFNGLSQLSMVNSQ